MVLSSHLLQGHSDFFPSGFLTEILCTFLSNARCMLRQSTYPWFDNLNDISLAVQIVSLIMLLSRASCYFLLSLLSLEPPVTVCCLIILFFLASCYFMLFCTASLFCSLQTPATSCYFVLPHYIVRFSLLLLCTASLCYSF